VKCQLIQKPGGINNLTGVYKIIHNIDTSIGDMKNFLAVLNYQPEKSEL
jgi:hypothetical protein